MCFHGEAGRNFEQVAETTAEEQALNQLGFMFILA